LILKPCVAPGPAKGSASEPIIDNQGGKVGRCFIAQLCYQVSSA